MRRGARIAVIGAGLAATVLAVGAAVRARRAARQRSLLDHCFLDHPREVGETYPQHMGVAFGVGAKLLGASAACFVHGVAPFLFTKTASRTITDLHRRIAGRGACPPEA